MRFLSLDNFIQDPYDTRSYNRFGYVWQKLEGKKASRLKIEPTEDEKANLRGKWGDSDHFEDVVMWFADNIKPFYNGTFPIWSKIQSELK